MKRCVAILVISLTFGCSSGDRPFHEHFETQFTPTEEVIQRIEKEIDQIAEQWRLTVARKDRESMSVLAGGKPAFVTFAFYEDDVVLMVGNFSGDLLTVTTVDHEHLPLPALELLMNQVLDRINRTTGLQFRPHGV